MSRHPTAEDFDHARDLRKHDTGPFPLRLEPAPPMTAAEVAWSCKATTTNKGAELVETYARSEIARANLDATLDRIIGSQPKRLIVAKLIGACEGLCSSGLLGDGEREMRLLIAEALSAFGMNAANRDEREPA
jgi:hypothetical protein